jgi:hypothetical protein
MGHFVRYHAITITSKTETWTADVTLNHINLSVFSIDRDKSSDVLFQFLNLRTLSIFKYNWKCTYILSHIGQSVLPVHEDASSLKNYCFSNLVVLNKKNKNKLILRMMNKIKRTWMLRVSAFRSMRRSVLCPYTLTRITSSGDSSWKQPSNLLVIPSVNTYEIENIQ